MNRTPPEPTDAWSLDIDLPVPEDAHIVLVDDEESVLKSLSKVLMSDGYSVNTFASSTQALEAIRRGGVALLIADIVMPEMSGLQLARHALEEDPELAIIILTGAAGTDTAVESLRLRVDDYLTKPVAPDDLIESVRAALGRRMQALYRRQVEACLRSEVERRTPDVSGRLQELRRSLELLSVLVRTLEAKDPYLKGHSERVARLSEIMARDLELDPLEIEEVATAGLLHDIGMLGIRESVIHKDGQLTEEEYRHIQGHVVMGAEILQPLAQLGRAVEYVRLHHERLNGSGYPDGRKGNEIPFGAQIVGVAECYASMTEDRAHRSACSTAEAVEILKQTAGVWYDGRILNALENAHASGEIR